MSTHERNAAIELLAEIAQAIEQRVQRHTVAEEAGSPTSSSRLTQDTIAFRDRIALVAGELLAPAAAAHINKVLDRITHVDYAAHPHNLAELTKIGKKLKLIVEDLRHLAARPELHA